MTRPAPALTSCTAALALTAIALAGCTSSPDTTVPPTQSAKTASPTGGSTTTTAGPGLPTGVTPAPIPTDVPNDTTQRKNVTLGGCAASPGGWGASGEATNPGKSPVTYQIQVFFTTTSATTVDTASTEVAVAPGATQKWSAEKKFRAPDKMLCVLRGVALKK